MNKMTLKKKIRSAISLFKEKRVVPIPTPVNVQQTLAGKVALITGGSGGIGLVIARAFVESGCKVIICGTQKEKLEKICEDISGNIHYLVLNVLDVEAMPAKIREAASMFEEKRIDILVNSAGVINHASFGSIDEKEYDSVMDVNLKGTFFMCQAMGNYMVENKIKGHILNVSSSSALRPANSPYRMSKWAIRGFTLGLAEQLIPHGIIVNAIAPGPVATPMMGKEKGDSLYKERQPSGRYAVPEEIAPLAVFMVSDFGNLIVGDTYYITGGSGTISGQY